MKPKTEEELEAERIAEEEKAAQKALELENGTQRSKMSKTSKMSKLIHNPDDPMNILDGQIEEEDRGESDGNINVMEPVGGDEENKQ